MAKKKQLRKDKKMIAPQKQKPLLSEDDKRLNHVKMTHAFIYRINNRNRAFSFDNKPVHGGRFIGLIDLTKIGKGRNLTINEKINLLNNRIATGHIEELRIIKPKPKPVVIPTKVEVTPELPPVEQKPRQIPWILVPESKFGIRRTENELSKKEVEDMFENVKPKKEEDLLEGLR